MTPFRFILHFILHGLDQLIEPSGPHHMHNLVRLGV